MKNAGKLILGMVFLFGMSAMIGANNTETVETSETLVRVDCHTVFTVCDNHAPDSHEHFVDCMEDNGC